MFVAFGEFSRGISSCFAAFALFFCSPPPLFFCLYFILYTGGLSRFFCAFHSRDFAAFLGVLAVLF